MRRAVFWSCWADLNRRPHPYQREILNFSKLFSWFLIIFDPHRLLSGTFRMQDFRSSRLRLWLVVWSARRFLWWLSRSPVVKRSHVGEMEVLPLHQFSLFFQPLHTFASGFWVFLEQSVGSLRIAPTGPNICAKRTVPRKYSSR